MSSRSFKLFLVAAAAVAMSFLVWQPWESGQERMEADTPPVSVDEGSRSEATVDQSSAQRSAVQREFLVVDEDGLPVSGAELHFCGIDDDAEMRAWIARAIDDPSVIDSGFLRASDLVGQTDDQGKVWLAEEQAGVAFAITANAVGVIAFLNYAESEGALRIPLKTHSVLTVSVVDALGRAAPNVPVNLSYSTEESRARRVPSASMARDIRWHRLGENRLTDANGQVAIPVDGHLGASVSRVRQEDGVELRVNADLPFGLSVDEQVDLNSESRVELQLAEAGGLRLLLWDDGFDLRPRLSLADDSTDRTRLMRPLWPDAKEGNSTGWRFPYLPLNKKVKVDFYRRAVPQAGSSSWVITSIPSIEVDGPSRVGEVDDRQLDPPTGIVLTGRVIDGEGQPIPCTNAHDLALSIRVRSSDSAMSHQFLQVDHFDDGRFEARLQKESLEKVGLEQFSEALFVYRQWQSGTIESVDVAQIWARVDLNVEAGASAHDLGDIRLDYQPAIFKVTVQDKFGVPIPGARVFFTRSVQSSDGLKATWEPTRTFFGNVPMTDAQGVYRLAGFDREDAWKTLTNRRVELSECRVSVGHEDFLTQVVEFPIEQEEMTVTLKRAETLHGEVLAPAFCGELTLALVEPGYDIRSPEFIARIQGQIGESMRGATDQPRLVPFELETLQPGEQDLVIFTTRSRVEIARIPGIDPAQIDALSEPIDLTDKIGLARLTLLDQAGERIQEESLVNTVGRFWIRERGWPSGSSGSGVVWDQGEVLVPIYLNSGYPGALTLEGEGSVPLSQLKPGSWTMQFAPAQTVRVRYSPPIAIPLGAALSARWQARDGFERVTPMGGDAECDVKFELQAGTNFTVTWTLTDAEGKRLGGSRELIEITDKHVASEEVIEVPVPLAVFEG